MSKRNNFGLRSAARHHCLPLLFLLGTHATAMDMEAVVARQSAERRFLANCMAALASGTPTLENRLALEAYRPAAEREREGKEVVSGELLDDDAAILTLQAPGDRLTPLQRVERELGGSLMFVQTLPGLSSNGTLISTFAPKGVRLEVSTHWSNRGKYFIAADHLATLHFTLNNLVPWGIHYATHPFVVIIPLHQPSGESPLRSLASISFSEAVTVGDLKLPGNSIIMYRKPEIDREPRLKAMLDFYVKNDFEIIPFDDSEGSEGSEGKDEAPGGKSAFEKAYARKIEAVKKVVLAHGGLDLKLSDNYLLETATVRAGKNLSTLDFFRTLVPDREVAVGSDEFTRLESRGGQWRSMLLRSGNNHVFDVGFMAEAHQGAQLNAWYRSLGLPEQALDHHARFTQQLLLSYRAMDLVFGHFQNQAKAYHYLETHLLPRNDEAFNRRIQADASSGKDLEALAKDYCDFAFLSTQEPGPFDLITLDGIIEHLRNQTMVGMHPEEARNFFHEYFSRSALFNHAHFSAAERRKIASIATGGYALNFMNNVYRPKSLSKDEALVLQTMLIGAPLEDLGTYLGGFIINFSNRLAEMAALGEPDAVLQQRCLEAMFASNLAELKGILTP